MKKNHKRVTHASCYSKGSGFETMRPAFVIFFVIYSHQEHAKMAPQIKPIFKSLVSLTIVDCI